MSPRTAPPSSRAITGPGDSGRPSRSCSASRRVPAAPSRQRRENDHEPAVNSRVSTEWRGRDQTIDSQLDAHRGWAAEQGTSSSASTSSSIRATPSRGSTAPHWTADTTTPARAEYERVVLDERFRRGKPRKAYAGHRAPLAMGDFEPALACVGDTRVEAPNVDLLAVGGPVFSGPDCLRMVCYPSRSTLLTGRRTGTALLYGLVTHLHRALPGIVTPQNSKTEGFFRPQDRADRQRRPRRPALVERALGGDQRPRFRPQRSGGAPLRQATPPEVDASKGPGLPFGTSLIILVGGMRTGRGRIVPGGPRGPG
jgi:hypothetical protein